MKSHLLPLFMCGKYNSGWSVALSACIDICVVVSLRSVPLLCVCACVVCHWGVCLCCVSLGRVPVLCVTEEDACVDFISA